VKALPRHRRELARGKNMGIKKIEICDRETLISGRLLRVARLDAEGYDFIDNPEAAVQMAQNHNSRIDILTFIQRLSDTSPKHPYHLELDNMAALEVSTFENWMMKQIDFKARNKARKAAKSGVTIETVPYTDEFVQGISNIYNETPIRQGKKFWHYRKKLEVVRKINGTFLDRSIFIAASIGSELIGFVKLVVSDDGTQAGLMQILSMVKHRDKAPNNALIAHSVRICAERNIPHLWYANFSYGNKQRDNLADFKRHNGFQKVSVPRYYIPLTVAGRAALQLGLHRNYSLWIPESLAVVYRKARTSWYMRRFPGFEGV
jgi:hypothetical protein